MNEELKEINERLDKIEKEIADIKANYISIDKFADKLSENINSIIQKV